MYCYQNQVIVDLHDRSLNHQNIHNTCITNTSVLRAFHSSGDPKFENFSMASPGWVLK